MPIPASHIVALTCAVTCHAVQAERSRLDDEADVGERGDFEVSAYEWRVLAIESGGNQTLPVGHFCTLK